MSVESHDLGPVPNLTALSGYGDSYVVPGDEVYVVSEDTDYIYLNTGSNPPADGFNIIKAIFLPGVWQRRSSGGGSGALRFNTVAVGALGSGRLIDTALTGLVDGTSLAWVESVKDTWRWDATSTLTADNITVCNPTANGANPGRFIRKLEPAPEWMQQITWVVDAANSTALASDENDGTTAATPLLTDTERQRRMGENPIWILAAYHLRYISDVPAAQEVAVRNRTAPAVQIFLHGSMTDGAGKTVLYSGTIGAVTTLDYPTNQPWEITSAGIPVSWTASGLVNQRIRRTTDNAIMWSTKDLGGAAPNARTRLTETNGGATFTAPFSTANPSVSITPTAADPIVVETLTSIGNFVVDIVGGRTTAVSAGLIVDSLDITGRYSCNGDRDVVFVACNLGLASSNQLVGSTQLFGCHIGATLPSSVSNFVITGGYQSAGSSTWRILGGTGQINRYMLQGSNTTLQLASVGARGTTIGWLISQLGCFDNGNQNPLTLVTDVTLSATASIWGANNALSPIFLTEAAMLKFSVAATALPASYFYIDTGPAGEWVTCDNRTSIPAFDRATGLYTAPRLLSPANLQATVAAGGFGGQFFDPVTGCGFVSIITP